MKRAIISAAVLSLAFSIPVFAANDGRQEEQAPNFEQTQADILRHLDAGAAEIQDARACVQAAKSHDDLKACRDKQMAKMDKKHSEMKEHGPGDGGPGGGSSGGQTHQ